MPQDTLTNAIVLATGLVAVAGVAAAAVVQFLRQIASLVAPKWNPSNTILTLVSSTLSGGLVVYLMVAQQIPLVISIIATLVALYAPKVAYDHAKSKALQVERGGSS